MRHAIVVLLGMAIAGTGLTWGCPADDVQKFNVFGYDDRRDVPPAWRATANAVAAIVPLETFNDQGVMQQRSLETVFCAGEPLRQRKATGVFGHGDEAMSYTSTGFLITERHIATTRHVMCTDPACEKNCAAAYRVVFGHWSGASGVSVHDIDRIVDAGGNEPEGDWMIVRLRTPVPASVAKPLSIDGDAWERVAELAGIAYPFGTPQAFIPGGKAIERHEGCLQSTLDCIAGCSGSPVFDAGAAAGEQKVIGLTIHAGQTYVCPHDAKGRTGCRREMACSDSGCDCYAAYNTISISPPKLWEAIAAVQRGKERLDVAPAMGHCAPSEASAKLLADPQELEAPMVCGPAVPKECREPAKPCRRSGP